VSAALGITFSVLIWSCSAALGLNLFLQSFPLVYDAIRYAGAAYLVWLGVKLIRNAFSSDAERMERAKEAIGLWARFPRQYHESQDHRILCVNLRRTRPTRLLKSSICRDRPNSGFCILPLVGSGRGGLFDTHRRPWFRQCAPLYRIRRRQCIRALWRPRRLASLVSGFDGHSYSAGRLRCPLTALSFRRAVQPQ